MSRDFFSPMSIMDSLFNEMEKPMSPMRAFDGMFAGIQTDIKEIVFDKDVNISIDVNPNNIL